MDDLQWLFVKVLKVLVVVRMHLVGRIRALPAALEDHPAEELAAEFLASAFHFLALP